jgi:hypothetical protein
MAAEYGETMNFPTFFWKARAGVVPLWYNQILWEMYMEEPE